MSAAKLDLLALLDSKSILLCCGSGGVGKTTTAASLGLLAASRGRSVLVLTIDPAKRLAQAMGLDSLSHEPQAIDISALSSGQGGGALYGMMLDTKRTFDYLVERYAPSPEARQAIFDNHYYQHVSSSLAGSREFMAMERVYEIASENRYDLVVVDTPPSQHALDFIDAPKRMFELFEGRFLKVLLKPYKVVGKGGMKLFKRGSAKSLQFLEKLTGYQFLNDLSEFFLVFTDMFEGFKQRSERVRALLGQSDSSFLLVCAPEPASLGQAQRFFQRLRGEDLPVGGMIVNRVQIARGPQQLSADCQQEVSDLASSIKAAPDLVQRLLDCYREQHDLALADAYTIENTPVAQQKIAIQKVPHFERDLHSLEDLEAFAGQLVAQQPAGGPDTLNGE
jgi:anion-transporting  ArsA/GET3 family ATPase